MCFIFSLIKTSERSFGGLNARTFGLSQNPQDFGIKVTGPVFEGFAQNDLFHEDPLGADHPLYTKGLNLALDAYLNKLGFEKELQDWFDFPVSSTSHSKDLIEGFLSQTGTPETTIN